MAKSKRIWRESQHPRDGKGRFSKRGGAAWIKRAAGELMSDAGAAARADGGRPRISRNAKVGAVLQAHADGGRVNPRRIPKLSTTPAPTVNVARFMAPGPVAPLPERPAKRLPRPASGAAGLRAKAADEQAPLHEIQVAARTNVDAAPTSGAEHYAAMRQHTLVSLARQAGIPHRNRSRTDIANDLAAHDEQVKASRKAKLNPSGVGAQVDTPRVTSDNGGMTSTTNEPQRATRGPEGVRAAAIARLSAFSPSDEADLREERTDVMDQLNDLSDRDTSGRAAKLRARLAEIDKTMADNGIDTSTPKRFARRPSETPTAPGPYGAPGDPIPSRGSQAWNRAVDAMQIVGPGGGPDRPMTPYVNRAPEVGDTVTAGGLNRKGTVVRAIRRNRTDGFDVQWDGEPYTRHQPGSSLGVVDVPEVIRRGRGEGGKTGPAKLLGGWQRNPNAYDPQAQTRRIEVDGKTYQVNNLGAGRMMNIRDNEGHINTVGWENWQEAADAIRKAEAKRAATPAPRMPTTNRKQIPRDTKVRAIEAANAKAAPVPVEKTPTRHLQTFADRMRGEFSDAERLEMRLRNEEERQKLRAQETEAARLHAEARANDTRPEREKLAEQLQQDRDADHVDMRSGRRNPQRAARMKQVEARIEDIDTEDRKAKIKGYRKGDKVKTTYGGEVVEVEVVGKTSDGYLRVLLPNGKRGSLHPKFIEGATPAPKADAAKVAAPARARISPDAKRGALAPVDTPRVSSHNGGMAATSTPTARPGEPTLGVTESSRGRTTTVTLPDGSTATRTSKTMAYTHAVVATRRLHADAHSLRENNAARQKYIDALQAWINGGADPTQLVAHPTRSRSIRDKENGVSAMEYYLPGFEPERVTRRSSRYSGGGTYMEDTNNHSLDARTAAAASDKIDGHQRAIDQQERRAAELLAGPAEDHYVARWSQRFDTAHAAIGSPELGGRNTRYQVVGVGGVADAPGKPAKRVPSAEEKAAALEARKADEKARQTASDKDFVDRTRAAVERAIDEGGDPEDALQSKTDKALRFMAKSVGAKLPRKPQVHGAPAPLDRTETRRLIVEAIRRERLGKA